MSESICLYCDKPIPLLARLTGEKEYCSREHRRLYQQQHSQMALARLLEASPGSGAANRPPPAAERAPDPEPEPVTAAPTTASPAVEPPPAAFLPRRPLAAECAPALDTALLPFVWKRSPAGLAAPEGAGRVSLLSPTSFLRRAILPAPAESGVPQAEIRLSAAAPPLEVRMDYLVECLHHEQRAGFGLPAMSALRSQRDV